MPRFRRENGKKVETKKYINLHIEDEVARHFIEIATNSGITYTELLAALMDGGKINGRPIGPLVNQLGKLLEDFESGKGVFSSI